MSRIDGTTNAQTRFLRAFRTNPAGPPPDAWPSPAILRRWLRKPTFKKALDSLQATLRFRADFLLATAASNAAQSLSTNPDLAPHDLRNLLRLSHTRQPKPTAPTEPIPPIGDGQSAMDNHTPAPTEPTSPIEPIPTIGNGQSAMGNHSSDFSQIPHWLTLTAGQGYLDKSTNRWIFYRQHAIELLLPVALQAGFYPPCQHHPNFPAPTCPDPVEGSQPSAPSLDVESSKLNVGSSDFTPPPTTQPHPPIGNGQSAMGNSSDFYHRLLHHPDALLCYMREYSTRFPDDHRFHKILKHCDPILPARGPKFEPKPT